MAMEEYALDLHAEHFYEVKKSFKDRMSINFHLRCPRSIYICENKKENYDDSWPTFITTVIKYVMLTVTYRI